MYDWSAVSVATAPTVKPLSLAELRTHLRLETADETDAYLTQLLDAAIAQVDGPSGVGYAMLAQTWQMRMDGFNWRRWWRSEQVLPGHPVTGITSITYETGDGAERTVDAEPDADHNLVAADVSYAAAGTRGLAGETLRLARSVETINFANPSGAGSMSITLWMPAHGSVRVIYGDPDDESRAEPQAEDLERGRRWRVRWSGSAWQEAEDLGYGVDHYHRLVKEGAVARVWPVTADGELSDWPSDLEHSPGHVWIKYTLGAASAAAVPADLKQALLMLVGQWYMAREGLISRSLSDPSIGVGRILDKYRWGVSA